MWLPWSTEDVYRIGVLRTSSTLKCKSYLDIPLSPDALGYQGEKKKRYITYLSSETWRMEKILVLGKLCKTGFIKLTPQLFAKLLGTVFSKPVVLSWHLEREHSSQWTSVSRGEHWAPSWIWFKVLLISTNDNIASCPISANIEVLPG